MQALHYPALQKQLQRFLIEPHPSIKDKSQRERARFLAGITLVLSMIGLFLALILMSTPTLGAHAGLLFVGWCSSLTLYILSRTAHFEVGIRLIVIQPFTFSLLLLIVYPGINMAVLLLLPIYLTSLFRPLRRLVYITLGSIAMVLLVAALLPGDWNDLPLVILLLASAATILGINNFMLRRSQNWLEQRSAELAESESRFRAAIDGSLDMFYLLAPQRNAEGEIIDFEVLDANPQVTAYSGHSREELIGKPASRVLSALHHDRIMEDYRRAIETQKSIRTEAELTSERRFEYQVVPVGVGVAVNAFDVTERKLSDARRLELAVERERVLLLQKFIEDTTHDLMTPLTVIRNSLYLVQKVPSPEKQHEHYQKIEGQVKRLQGRIQDMLTMSKLDRLTTNEFDFHKRDVNALLSRLVASCQPSARMKEQQLSYVEKTPVPMIMMDEARLEIALLNLVDNAIKYTPQGGSITVSSSLEHHMVLIEVRDTGAGIAGEDLPHVFERFYRGEDYRPQDAGVGLGLSIAQRIVKAHKGSIQVESQPQQGTVFQIRLPCIPSTDDAAIEMHSVAV